MQRTDQLNLLQGGVLHKPATQIRTSHLQSETFKFSLAFLKKDLNTIIFLIHKSEAIFFSGSQINLLQIWNSEGTFAECSEYLHIYK